MQIVIATRYAFAGTSPRAGIVAGHVLLKIISSNKHKKNLKQYVLLGAGLDTFVQRGMDIATKLQVFEIDKPDMQTWKQQRLKRSGFGNSKIYTLYP